MASVSSLFSSTSSAGGEGICAETRIATSSIIPRQPVSSLELLIHFMFAPVPVRSMEKQQSETWHVYITFPGVR